MAGSSDTSVFKASDYVRVAQLGGVAGIVP